jgi:hypothetical protein
VSYILRCGLYFFFLLQPIHKTLVIYIYIYITSNFQEHLWKSCSFLFKTYKRMFGFVKLSPKTLENLSFCIDKKYITYYNKHTAKRYIKLVSHWGFKKPLERRKRLFFYLFFSKFFLIG